MAYSILRFAKHKGGASKALSAHHERTKEFYASNPDIDKSRTVQNYYLIAPRWSYEQEIRHRLRMAGCRVRKDSVKFVDTLVTVSPEFAKAHESEMPEYFNRAFDFLEERVGEENIISAVVHMDEKTPHMHFLHVPVTPDGRLNANKIYTRQSLRKLQAGLPAHLQSRGFVIERGVEQTPGSAKRHLDTREFKQQQEALNNLILESEELAQNSRQILDALEQREEELKKSIEMYEQQAEEAEKILQGDSSLPKASLFNYQSVLKKASFIIAELKKALAVTHIAQKQKESLQKEMETLRTKQTQLEAEYTAHRKQSHEEKEELEKQLKKMKRIMAGYQEFLRLPEIRPLHIEFVERKRTEQLQRQLEEERQRQEQEARDRERRQARSARGMRMR